MIDFKNMIEDALLVELTIGSITLTPIAVLYGMAVLSAGVAFFRKLGGRR